MAIKEIITYPDERLRTVARPVADPTAEEVRQLAQDLADTMYDAPGVGLASTQIGSDLRVVVTDTEWRSEEGVRDLKVWVNPEIIWASEDTEVFEEGCLSVPGTYEEVERPAAIRLRWQDLDGDQHESAFDGFQAVALQHEFDHLDGKLFIDRLKPLKQKMLKKRLHKRKKQEQE